MDKKTAKFIINLLREGTIQWHVKNSVINRDRQKVHIGEYLNGNPQYKYYYKCQKCEEFFEDPSVLEMDHIKEVGHIDLSDLKNIDWTSIVYRIYCDESNLQALCSPCHKKKTSIGNASIRYQRKGIRVENDL